MRQQKLFIGRTLREVRLRERLTQADFAHRLGVSASYLSQMENDNRHVSATVLVGLAEHFDVDIGALAKSDGDRLLTDLLEAFRDPGLEVDAPDTDELALVARNAPAAGRALLSLHQRLSRADERLAELDDSLARSGQGADAGAWEEVRDFFHYRDNHIDELDRAGEALSIELGLGLVGVDSAGHPPLEALRARLATGHGASVRSAADTGLGVLRRYDPATRTLTLNAVSPTSTQAFQAACQLGLLEHGERIDAIAASASFRASDASDICRIGLTNYLAAATLMPYDRFRAAANELRHDLTLLADRFGTSEEQVAHRLSTLQRPGEAGIPFFFARVDRAGNITKRHSAAPLKFARFGSACPLWNVHRAFETPGRTIRQLAETPDGVRYLCLARTVTRRSGGFADPVRHYAIALGCEIRHAHALVHADGLDVGTRVSFEPIGVSCRTCERGDCHQRAVPPLRRALDIEPALRRVVPYAIGD